MTEMAPSRHYPLPRDAQQIPRAACGTESWVMLTTKDIKQVTCKECKDRLGDAAHKLLDEMESMP
jgi:hypothetical protein